MHINLMNERIQLLVPQVRKDKIGNHFNDWHQIYECAAQVSEIRPGEKDTGHIVYDDTQLTFKVRYSSEVSRLDSTKLRIMFHGEKYEVLGIDYLNYKYKQLQIHARKVSEWSR